MQLPFLSTAIVTDLVGSTAGPPIDGRKYKSRRRKENILVSMLTSRRPRIKICSESPRFEHDMR